MDEVRKSIQSRRSAQLDQIQSQFTDELEKARGLPIGTIRKRPNGNFIKTADGWKYHSSLKAGSTPESKEKGAPKQKRSTAKLTMTWNPSGYRDDRIQSKFEGNEVTIAPDKSQNKVTTYLNGRVFDREAVNVSDAKRNVEIHLKERHEKLKKFIGKTVNIFEGTRDKIIDFGEKYELHARNNERMAANPGGYAQDQGSYFLVERNGIRKILNPGFGDRLLKL